MSQYHLHGMSDGLCTCGTLNNPKNVLIPVTAMSIYNVYHPRGNEQKNPNQIPQKICRQIVKGYNIDFGGGVIQFEHNVFVLQMGRFFEKSPQI